MKSITVGNVKLGGRAPLALIAGPCVIESRAACLNLAARLSRLARREQIPLIFKASFDKANRTSIAGFRGPGLEQGLAILAEVKQRYKLPVVTDVHDLAQAAAAAQVVDMLQIPAFLCRQTDLLTAAAATGLPVNIKKGQFLAAEDMEHVAAKCVAAGNRRICLTERGTTFGYHNLVVDMRGLPIMQRLGYPVVFDATHSVQRPGGGGAHSAGDSEWVPYLSRAAVATGCCAAVFLETYVDPSSALSDGANALPVSRLRGLWKGLVRLHDAV